MPGYQGPDAIARDFIAYGGILRSARGRVGENPGAVIRDSN